MASHAQVKIVTTNGQVSLGKKFAGKKVLVDQINENTWLIKTGEFIPDSEKWLYEPKHLLKIEKALTWAEKKAPEDNFNNILKGLGDDDNKN